jgi:3',5'-cyclic AMP phosphodiesterase CpdA
LIDDNHLKADILLCCGDLADKADPGAMKYVWTSLSGLARGLGAKLCATAGNHDVDSRYGYNQYDARGVLQSLNPTFPVNSARSADQYWSRQFCVVIVGSLRLILVNSAAYHGQGLPGTGSPEYSHGRIADSTVERLKDVLDAPAESAINVLAVHHHPMAIAEVDDDGSHMVNGAALIDLLAKDRQAWMIIHGHKHVPRLIHGQGGNNAPVLFGCASFSAVLTGRWATRIANQFYLIDLPISPAGRSRLPIAGRFRSWDWHMGLGWEPASEHSGLPSTGGFGCRDHSTLVAANVAATVRKKSPSPVMWHEILKVYPQYEFLMPADIARVKTELETSHSVKVQWGGGYPAELTT